MGMKPRQPTLRKYDRNSPLDKSVGLYDPATGTWKHWCTSDAYRKDNPLPKRLSKLASE